MNNKTPFSQKLENFVGGKGFYIVLFLCIFVIGISAWSLIDAGVFSEKDILSTVDVNTGSIGGALNQDDSTTSNDIEKDDPVSVWNSDNEAVTDKDDETENDGETKTDGDEETSVLDSLTFALPVSGEVICTFSTDELVYDKTLADWRVHTAVDFSAELGTKVTAVADGTVTEVYEDDLLGTTVVVEHGDGLFSVYSNLAATPTVSIGETVVCGDTIGSVGDTAIAESSEVAHLHFAMEKDGDACDPFLYLPKS